MRIISILLILIGFSISFGAETQSGPPVNYVVIHKPGPKWQAGTDFQEQPGVMDHVKHYKKFQQDGKLLLGGPFLDDTGGMMVATEKVSLKEMTDFAKADPAVKNGLLVFEVKPWMIVMKESIKKSIKEKATNKK